MFTFLARELFPQVMRYTQVSDYSEGGVCLESANSPYPQECAN